MLFQLGNADVGLMRCVFPEPADQITGGCFDL
jgi:hypothetical protein